MIECHSNETDPVNDTFVLLAGNDAGEVSEPEVGAADGADAFTQVRLLDSLAAFTHHRDVAALDHSLVLSLAQLTGAHSVILAKRSVDGPFVEGLVCCVADGAGGYRVHGAEADEIDPALRLLHRSLHRLQAQTGMAQGMHRLAVPILREGKAVGALQLDSHMSPQASRPLVDGFARIYGNYTALLQESERDKLTGLYNRRSLDRQLQRMFREGVVVAGPSCLSADEDQRHTPDSSPQQVWLAILDIDHFKRINDTYGHIYGDEVILLLAQQMRACFRRNDVLFRFGGEEFVILFSADEEATVVTILERFRERIAAYDFPQVGNVTVSLGYAKVGEHDYPASVLDRADKALYHAKQNGRNCTHGYEQLRAHGLLESDLASGSIDLF